MSKFSPLSCLSYDDETLLVLLLLVIIVFPQERGGIRMGVSFSFNFELFLVELGIWVMMALLNFV